MTPTRLESLRADVNRRIVGVKTATFMLSIAEAALRLAQDNYGHFKDKHADLDLILSLAKEETTPYDSDP